MSRRLATLRIVAIATGAIVAVGAAGTVAAVEVVAHQPPAKLTVAQVAAKVRLSVVTIKATQFRDGVTEGQGFLFGNGRHVMTSASLLAHATHVDVVSPTGEARSGSLVGIDKVHGVAELITYDMKRPALVAAPKSVAAGERVMVVGNPYSQLPYTVHQGVVAGTSRQLVLKSGTLGDLIATDVTVSAVNIGGPMVDMSGKVVGIVLPGQGGDSAYAIPVSDLKAEAMDWAKADNLVHLGPPLVTQGGPDLLLAGVPLDGFVQSTLEPWPQRGVRVVYQRPANYVYGGTSLTFYIQVEGNESDAKYRYDSNVSYSSSVGYATVATSSALGDEVTTLQIAGERPEYNVIWRDRNVVCDFYMASGRPPQPDVSLATLVALAVEQEAVIGADLANW